MKMIFPSEGLILHHSASMTATVEQIRRYHIEKLRWLDIGYHFLIDFEGKVMRGRSLSFQGCHGEKYTNQHYLGLCCLGNFEENKMKDLQYKALLDFLTSLQIIFDFSRVNIKGHKEIVATLCPGKYFPLDTCKEIFEDKQ